MHAGADPARAVADVAVARIGPNAILRTAEALRDAHGAVVAERVVHEGTGRAWDAMPTAMVDEREVQALVRAVHAALGETVAAAVLHDAGRRTADYLLAHRIPRPVQCLVTVLPTRLGLAVLLGAMARHAWTFAGSGRFAYGVGRTTWLEVRGCPMCRGVEVRDPACAFYAGTFERLVRALVDDRLRVHEVACEALGDPACRFVLRRG